MLEGIKYLSDGGRTLKTLTRDTLFLTQSGQVKIGMEDYAVG